MELNTKTIYKERDEVESEEQIILNQINLRFPITRLTKPIWACPSSL